MWLIGATGSGEAAKVRQEVAIYESLGYLIGKQFIAGMVEAVTGMKIGETRKLIVPPANGSNQNMLNSS